MAERMTTFESSSRTAKSTSANAPLWPIRIVCFRFTDRVVLAHLDAGNGDVEASKTLAGEVTPLIVPLLRLNGVLVSEPGLTAEELRPLPLPGGIEPGRYNLYRRISSRSLP